MTQPILVPILNLKSFLPLNFSKNFKRYYYIYDIIGKSFIDEDFSLLIKKMEQNKNTDKDKLNSIKSFFNESLIKETQKLQNKKNLINNNLDGKEILKYLN